MRHRKTITKLDRPASQRKALLSQLASSFFLHEKIETTVAKAKALRSYAEKLITLAKEDSVAHRRKADKFLEGKKVVQKLFEVIGPKYKDRKGGYTSTHRTTKRQGDSGEKAIIALV